MGYTVSNLMDRLHITELQNLGTWSGDPEIQQRSGCSGFSLGDVKSGRKEENWKHSFGRLWPDIHAN